MSTTATLNVFALVLAAGEAVRFGATKQLVDIDGVALVRRSLDAAVAACGDSSVLVVGHDWRAVWRSCAGTPCFLIHNDRYRDGLGTSIAAGSRALAPVAAAVIVVLADQVRVTARHLAALRRTWSGDAHEIVATEFAGTLGPPVLLPRASFADLSALSGDAGARQLLEDRRFAVRRIRFEDAAIDIDTPADLSSAGRV